MWSLTFNNWQYLAFVLSAFYVHGSLDSCYQSFESQRGHFNYSSSNSSCIWTIHRPPGWRINLNFTLISSVGNEGKCNGYLLVLDHAHKRIIDNYCLNSTLSRSITVKSNKLTIIISPISWTDWDFYGNYDSVNISSRDECHHVLDDKQGYLNFSSSEYPTPVNQCQWTIHRPSNWRINISLISFGESQAKCDQSYIEIFGKGFSLGKYCLNKVPGSILSLSNELTIIYTRNTSAAAKFRIFYDSFLSRGKCNKEFRAQQGNLKFSSSQYSRMPHVFCVWKIRRPSGWQINLNFTSISSRNDEKYNGHIKIVDIVNKRYIASYYQKSSLPGSITLRSNEINIYIYSGSNLELQGFYNSFKDECHQALNTKQGYLNFSSSEYSHSVNQCKWTIHRPSNWRININVTFISFGEHPGQCNQSYIKMFENGTFLEKYCLNNEVISIPSLSNELTIVYTFRSSSAATEFHIFYNSFFIQEKTSTTQISLSETSLPVTTTRKRESVPLTNSNKKHMTLYIALSLGCVFSLVMIIFFAVYVRRRIRKNAQIKEHAKHWVKNNRAYTSQDFGNEEVETDNPMYEGGRSRSTSNVLYGVPEHADDDAACDKPRVDLVTGNACALYQNVDVTYSEPTNERNRVDSGNYERIKSFINIEPKETKENSYADPSVLLNDLIVSVNASYVSSQRN